MQMFIFLVVMAFLVYMLFSFLLPPVIDEDEDVWDAAEVRLESLLQGLADPRPELRERYRNRILSMGPTVIPRLVDVLSQELFIGHHEVRIRRLMALLRDFGLRSVPALLHLLEEEGTEPDVAQAVRELLLDIGTSALPLIVKKLSSPLVMPLLPVFKQWGQPALRSIMKAFHKNPQQTMWRRVLLSFEDEAIPLVESAVANWDGKAQNAAFHILAELAPLSSTELFHMRLTDKDPAIRASSVLALGKMRVLSTLEDVELLLTDEYAQVRIRAIEAYARIGLEETIPALNLFLKESRIELSRLEESLTAAIALVELGEPSDAELVDLGLASSSWRLRRMAFTLLEYMEHEKAHIYLERLLWDRDDRSVQEAIRILAIHATRPGVQALLTFASEYPLGHQRSLWVEHTLLERIDWITKPVIASLEQCSASESGIALRVLLRGHALESVVPVLLALESSEDPDSLWGIEPEDLHLFLQNVSEHSDIVHILRRFVADYTHSPLVPALELFLSQVSESSEPTAALSMDSHT